jgi:hypothetical protein
MVICLPITTERPIGLSNRSRRRLWGLPHEADRETSHSLHFTRFYRAAVERAE